MRKIILYSLILFQLAIIGSLLRGVQLSRRSGERIAEMQVTRDRLLEEQHRLKQEGEYVQSQFYLEKVAREELHLSKEGETVVIVPEGRQVNNLSNPVKVEEVELKNWQKWWRVLSASN